MSDCLDPPAICADCHELRLIYCRGVCRNCHAKQRQKEQGLCRHCQAKKATRSRGLCFCCYYAPGVRDLYPPQRKYTAKGPPANQPTMPLLKATFNVHARVQCDCKAGWDGECPACERMQRSVVGVGVGAFEDIITEDDE